MIGNFPSHNVLRPIREVFSHTSKEVRELGNRSHQRYLRGEKSFSEVTYTETLIDKMADVISDRIKDITDKLAAEGASISVAFSATNIRSQEENPFGPDIGLRFYVKTPNYILVKGVLIQCKRMYTDNGQFTFNQMKTDGEKQARKMLTITPASFFMLFNFGTMEDLSAIANPHVSVLSSDVEKKGRSRKPSASAESIGDLGIAMIPASRILALSFAATQHGTPFPTEASEILKGCIPFDSFLVDLLNLSYVGDVRDTVVRLVTPPDLRDKQLVLNGLPTNEFVQFGVKRYLNIELEINSF